MLQKSLKAVVIKDSKLALIFKENIKPYFVNAVFYQEMRSDWQTSEK
jgi:hypothetical protein